MKSFFAEMFGITQMREAYTLLGAGRFVTLMLGTIAYIFAGAALSMSAVWPGTCDHEGHRLAGLIKEFRCSPDLLAGGWVEIGLFAWLWSLPTIGITAVAWSWIKHYQRKHRSNGRLGD